MYDRYTEGREALSIAGVLFWPVPDEEASTLGAESTVAEGAAVERTATARREQDRSGQRKQSKGVAARR